MRKILNDSATTKGLQDFRKDANTHTDSTESSTKTLVQKQTTDTRTHYLLNKLIEAADRNSAREKGGFRYDPEIEKYASHLRLIRGPLAKSW